MNIFKDINSFEVTILLQIILINITWIIVVTSYFNIDINKYTPSRIIIIISIVGVTTIGYLLLKKNYKEKNCIRLNGKKKILWILLFIFLGILLFIWNQRPIEYHHYSYYVGPIFDVIKGKSLLHDTPSQYGYLSINFLALFEKYSR